MPYQCLKELTLATAARARTRAEWGRNASTAIKAREIDREASQPAKHLDQEEIAFVRTAMIGGTMAAHEIATFNEDTSPVCTYCLEAQATAEHIRWGCSFFEPVRTKTDPEIAAIPRSLLTSCIKCAIAPAMRA